MSDTTNGPIRVVVDKTNQCIWVTNFLSNTVSKIYTDKKRRGTPAKGSPYKVDDSPFGVETDGKYVWVINYYSPSMSKLNAKTGASITAPGKKYWVKLPTPKKPPKEPKLGGPADVAYDPIGKNLWISYNDPFDPISRGIPPFYVAAHQASSGKRLGIVQVGMNPIDMLYAEKNIWVANSGEIDNTIVQIDPKQKFSGRNKKGYADQWLPLVALDSGSQELVDVDTPGSMAWDGKYIWVAGNKDVTENSRRYICRIDPKGSYTIPRIQWYPLPQRGVRPHAIACNGKNLWITAEKIVSGKEDKRGIVYHAQIDKNGDLSPTQFKQIKDLGIGARPMAIAYANGLLWVPCFGGYENDDGTNVALIDPKTS